MKNITPQQLHIPVLRQPVRDFLCPKKGEKYLDLTAGFGGHAADIIAVVGQENATLVDRDLTAISFLREKFSQAVFRQQDFWSAAQELAGQGAKFDMILADLGVSSPQLDVAERGFSFTKDALLDMRMDQSQGETAAELIRRLDRKALTQIIVRYGEERPKVAARIALALKQGQPSTTLEAARLIAAQAPRGYHKIHPATRTFQALRIAVNDELRQVEETLQFLPQLLNEGGRVAIISFHSLEDRLVKQFMQEHQNNGYEAEIQVLTKKPIRGDTEDVNNPRARSAKLRVARKIKKKGDL